MPTNSDCNPKCQVVMPVATGSCLLKQHIKLQWNWARASHGRKSALGWLMEARTFIPKADSQLVFRGFKLKILLAVKSDPDPGGIQQYPWLGLFPQPAKVLQELVSYCSHPSCSTCLG